jgi:hypothetical protein
VLALGAAFEAGKAVGDAPFDGLVVAGFEMQAVDPLQSAPVAAIGDLVIDSCLRLSILKNNGFDAEFIDCKAVIAIKLDATGCPLRSAMNITQFSGMAEAMAAKNSGVRYGGLPCSR